jgi:hypothetical protein
MSDAGSAAQAKAKKAVRLEEKEPGACTMVRVVWYPSKVIVAERFSLQHDWTGTDVVMKLSESDALPAADEMAVRLWANDMEVFGPNATVGASTLINPSSCLHVARFWVHAGIVCPPCRNNEAINGTRYYSCGFGTNLCERHFARVDEDRRHQFTAFRRAARRCPVSCDAVVGVASHPVYGQHYHRRGHDEDLCAMHFHQLTDPLIKSQFVCRFPGDDWGEQDYDSDADPPADRLPYDELFNEDLHDLRIRLDPESEDSDSDSDSDFFGSSASDDDDTEDDSANPFEEAATAPARAAALATALATAAARAEAASVATAPATVSIKMPDILALTRRDVRTVMRWVSDM